MHIHVVITVKNDKKEFQKNTIGRYTINTSRMFLVAMIVERSSKPRNISKNTFGRYIRDILRWDIAVVIVRKHLKPRMN